MIQSTATEGHKSSISHETSEYRPSSDTLSDGAELQLQLQDDSSSSSSGGSGGEESKVPIIHTPPPPPTSSSSSSNDVVVLQVRDITIYLVGTSHSGNDVDSVKALVEELCPYVVMVELCRSRRSVLYYNAREQQQESKNNDISLMAMAKQCFRTCVSCYSAHYEY